MENKNFQLLVDGVPYDVRVAPFTYNDDTRFTVSYNGSEDYIFAWDSDLSLFAAIGDEGLQIPDNLEEAISLELFKLVRKSQA